MVKRCSYPRHSTRPVRLRRDQPRRDRSNIRQRARPVSSTILWTAPNAFTLLRLLCLPIFLWLLFAQDNRAGAAWMLVALASTDWIDGYIARRFDQVSEFGKIFDPTVDRLFFFVSVIAIVIDGSIPVWFAVAVLFREVAVGAMMAIATLLFGMERFDVTWWGKTATFLLMAAVPSFLISEAGVSESDFFAPLRGSQASRVSPSAIGPASPTFLRFEPGLQPGANIAQIVFLRAVILATVSSDERSS